MAGIQKVDLSQTDSSVFRKHLADCIILTSDYKLLLQHRVGPPVTLNAFGGHVEEGESVMQALVRELNEELGARVMYEDVVFLGAVSEDFTNHTELVHVHFWHDRHNTINGCYEGEARYYESVSDALNQCEIMEYAQWALKECIARGLLK